MLKIENIDFTYKDKVIFKDMSLFFNENTFNVIIGNNGLGKTTLIKLMVSVYEENKGKITWNNKDIHSNEIKKLISYSPSELNLYAKIKIKVFLNYIGSFAHEKKELEKKIKYFATKFGATDLLNKEISKLSLGEVKKVILIQSFLTNGKILIFDEPLSNLEPDRRKYLFELWEKNIKEGKTIIVSTHNLYDFKNKIDSVLVLSKKRKPIIINNPKSISKEYMRSIL